MRKQLNKLFATVLVFIPFLISAQSLKVEDFRKEKLSDREVIQNAFDALELQGHGSIEFDGSRTYEIDDCIALPRFNDKIKGQQLFVIEGNGCTINIKNRKACGLYRKPENQKEALNKMMRFRFIIQNFSFYGGAKGIELCATFGSVIQNCNFTNQRIAAIDVQFGLSTSIIQCLATNCYLDNFVLRTGEDWGGSVNNSQSNHSRIENCRVYARKGSNSAFKVLSSSGVQLEQVISEGSSEINYSIIIDSKSSTTVRMFSLKNLHLEHAPIKSGIYIASTGVVNIEDIYFQKNRKHKNELFTLIHAANKVQQINIKNIPHYVGGTVMRQTTNNGGTVWNLEYCNHNFFDEKRWRILDTETNEELTELPGNFYGQGYMYRINKRYKSK